MIVDCFVEHLVLVGGTEPVAKVEHMDFVGPLQLRVQIVGPVPEQSIDRVGVRLHRIRKIQVNEPILNGVISLRCSLAEERDERLSFVDELVD